ncbi:Cytochrome b, partial [Trachymyrmex cornetzi]
IGRVSLSPDAARREFEDDIFSINNSTLNLFFSFYFILPFIIIFLIFIYLFFQHLGFSNPTGINRDLYKVPFHIFFSIKNLGFIFILSLFFIIIIIQYPYIFKDSDNFTPAIPLITPIRK